MMALRSRLAQRLTLRFPLQAAWGAQKTYPDSGLVPGLGRSMEPVPAHFAASPRRLHVHPRGWSRARGRRELAEGVPAPHWNLRLRRPSPAVRRDGRGYLLPDLYLSPGLPVGVDDWAPVADRAACGDTQAPAALRGEIQARPLGLPGAVPPPNPESRQPQAADCSGARIPQTIRHISSSNTPRSPGRPSARCQSFRLTYNLPESLCGPCPRARPSASSTAFRPPYNWKSPAAMLPDEMPRSAACPAARPFPRQCAARPTHRHWQTWKPVPQAGAEKCRSPVLSKSRQWRLSTSGLEAWSALVFRRAVRFRFAARIRKRECICNNGLRPGAARS